VLVSIKGNLKEQAKEWQDDWQVTVPVYYILTWQMYQKAWFELQENDEAWVDPRNPAHYMLSWIACVNNLCKIYAALKASNTRYPERMDWRLEEKRYRDVKFIYRWHLALK